MREAQIKVSQTIAPRRNRSFRWYGESIVPLPQAELRVFIRVALIAVLGLIEADVLRLVESLLVRPVVAFHRVILFIHRRDIVKSLMSNGVEIRRLVGKNGH